MSRSVYLHEGLDFPEHLEAGVDHGFNWLERRTLWRRSALYQSIALSLFVHIAAISMFISFPDTNDGVETPWVEVRLVSLGRGEIGDGVEQRGGAGGNPARIWPTNFQVPASSVSPPEPVPEIAAKSREKDPKATINLASARSRSANKPKEPPKSSAPQGEARDIGPSSSFTSQPANATVSLPGNGGLGQALAESGEGGARFSEGGQGKGLRGNGPFDAEFGGAGGPRFAHKSLPKYPQLARQLGKEATVVLRVTIDESGRPILVETLKTAGSGFDEEAVKAVKESHFHPANREGKPVTCRAILPIRFELRGSE